MRNHRATNNSNNGLSIDNDTTTVEVMRIQYSGDNETESDEPAFEAALRELEEVVTALETGNVPLEESMALLQRGMALAERCDQTLTQAEATLEQLITNSDGELVTQRIEYDTDEDEDTPEDE